MSCHKISFFRTGNVFCRLLLVLNHVAFCQIDVMYQVSALSLDPSGARLVSGGFEYDIKFWDFAGMDSSLRSFRTITPCERSTALLLPVYFACQQSLRSIEITTGVL